MCLKKKEIDPWEEAGNVVCICCPRCGKYHGKVTLTDAKIKCSKCKRYYYAIVTDGIVVAMKNESLWQQLSEAIATFHEEN